VAIRLGVPVRHASDGMRAVPYGRRSPTWKGHRTENTKRQGGRNGTRAFPYDDFVTCQGQFAMLSGDPAAQDVDYVVREIAATRADRANA
jgi:hypothetical protein